MIVRELEGNPCPECGTRIWHGRAAGEKLQDGSHGGELMEDGAYYTGEDIWQCSRCGRLADVYWMGLTVTGEKIPKGTREREEAEMAKMGKEYKARGSR